ncbi:hypothetical protein [Methylobacterium sp. JK268]
MTTLSRWILDQDALVILCALVFSLALAGSLDALASNRIFRNPNEGGALPLRSGCATTPMGDVAFCHP